MIANLMCATKRLKNELMRQTSVLTNKKAQGQQLAGLLGHAAIRPHPSHTVAAGVDSDLWTLNHDSGHNFANIPARTPTQGTPAIYATPACPAFPQRCPFGGACHACPVTVQAKPINQPGDSYEQEADRMAERVMRMPESSIPTTTASSTKATPSAAPPIVHEVLRSPGQPLDPATRTFFEPRFGHDFSRVRVHTDMHAAASARAVNAIAYTVGTHIVFSGGAYSLGKSEGRELLAHELAHVQQQPAFDGSARLHVDDSYEQSADAAARVAMINPPGDRTGQVKYAQKAFIGRQPAVPLRPPVRPPPQFRVIPGGRTDPSGRPLRVPEGQRYAPDPFDTSFEAALERANIRDYAERQRMQAERPVATLDRGGSPPDFITEHGQRRIDWLGGPGGGGSEIARIRRFHVLDAIEAAVGRANTERDLEAVLDRYVPMVALLNRGIDLPTRRRALEPMIRPLISPIWDEPVFPSDLDPQAITRLEVFETAARRRAQTVPALAQSRLVPQRRRRGGCRLEPISPLGDDPLSVLYCHQATGSPYSYRITIESATGAPTRRWAEIDALRGDTWYECKCGYEALLTGAARGEGVARAVLERLDRQVLNHADIARTCGLQYRYIVSNNTVRNILQNRWFGNVVIDVVPFEPCD